MKQRFQRWYEKDECLKVFMTLLKDIDIEQQCEIAVDIIIKSSSIIDRDYTKMIQEISDYDPKNYKRWYDRNPSVHVAIESLRDLSEEQRNTIIQEFTGKIIDENYSEIEGID